MVLPPHPAPVVPWGIADRETTRPPSKTENTWFDAPQPPDTGPVQDSIFQLGERVGEHYEIIGLLGEGGMGQVFEALDHILDRRVAIKAAWPMPGIPPLRNEARALAAFRHPSLVTVHTLAEHKGTEFLVMERIYGVSLATHMRTRHDHGQPLRIVEVLKTIQAIAEGLAIVHRAGLAHRDVKPDNVMLTPDHRVVLMDFGLVLPEFHLSNQTSIAGSPPYMAPEALTNVIELGEGHLLDVYSLGVLAFEMLANKRPVEGSGVSEVWAVHQAGPPPDVRQLRSEVPAGFAQLISEMLAKVPHDRPQSAQAVSHRIGTLLDAQARLAKAETVAPARDFKRVLIVDDNADIARVLSFYMKQILGKDTEVETAEDGEQAIEIIREKDFDLMLLDLHMPKMNGIEVCMTLRGEHLAERMVVISVSAGAQEDDRQLLYQLGIHQFVEKGTNLKERLGAAVRESLGIGED